MGPILVGGLKEKNLKKVYLIHIFWPKLNFKQQMPHMFSRPVFIISTIKYSKLGGKRSEKQPRAKLLSNLKYQIHLLKKWLKKGR